MLQTFQMPLVNCSSDSCQFRVCIFIHYHTLCMSAVKILVSMQGCKDLSESLLISYMTSKCILTSGVGLKG